LPLDDDCSLIAVSWLQTLEGKLRIDIEQLETEAQIRARLEAARGELKSHMIHGTQQ
jgi:hypothetical protein